MTANKLPFPSQIDDCTQDWTFPDNSLDYIHIRWLVGSIADWASLFRQAYRCLKPGGYLESHEPSSGFESDDGTVTESSALAQWGRFFVGGGEKIGRPFTVFDDDSQVKGMEEAGFVNIEKKDFKVSEPIFPTIFTVTMARKFATDNRCRIQWVHGRRTKT